MILGLKVNGSMTKERLLASYYEVFGAVPQFDEFLFSVPDDKAGLYLYMVMSQTLETAADQVWQTHCALAESKPMLLQIMVACRCDDPSCANRGHTCVKELFLQPTGQATIN
jgi:hypothetical protein